MPEPDYIEEDLERLSEAAAAPNVLSSESFWRPLHKLFSKAAVTVDVNQTVGEALELIRETEYGAIVVTRKGKLAGLLTERELLVHVVGVIENFEQHKVSEVMQADPVSLRRDDPIVYALHNMQVGGCRHIPIVDAEDRPISVVSIKDVVRFILSHFPEDVLNVTTEPYRGPVSREGA
ncbi:MAG: CBS domain-containing protein [Myxococcales bacterium]|nr:CBS domain-containing protein [Myxococcales bacterium]